MARRDEIPEKEVKRLFAVSGNRCAFPGCDRTLSEPTAGDEPGVVTCQIAHVVASSRQGPRGRSELSDEERNRAENLILLCGQHHVLVDRRPRTYTVDVLLEMKRRHEAPYLAAAAGPEPVAEVTETLVSSLMVVSELPRQIRVAPYLASSTDQVAAAVRRDPASGPVPFITREGRVFAFHDLRSDAGPFAHAVDRGAVETLGARDLCASPDGQRRYVDLLNRTMSWHLRGLGLRFDPAHGRHYYTLAEGGISPRVEYRSKTGRAMTREVVREAKRLTGETRGFWWHEAVKLRFLPAGVNGWVLSVRPEFHLSRDGSEPLDGPLVGRRVTRRKSRIYNSQYVDLIQFWREALMGARGRPRLILRVGGQRITIENDVLTCDVNWPGVPNDVVKMTTGPIEDDLLSLLDAMDHDDEGDGLDDEEWDDA